MEKLLSTSRLWADGWLWLGDPHQVLTNAHDAAMLPQATPERKPLQGKHRPTPSSASVRGAVLSCDPLSCVFRAPPP